VAKYRTRWRSLKTFSSLNLTCYQVETHLPKMVRPTEFGNKGNVLFVKIQNVLLVSIRCSRCGEVPWNFSVVVRSHGAPALTSFPTDGLWRHTAVTCPVPVVTVLLLRGDHRLICNQTHRFMNALLYWNWIRHQVKLLNSKLCSSFVLFADFLKSAHYRTLRIMYMTCYHLTAQMFSTFWIKCSCSWSSRPRLSYLARLRSHSSAPCSTPSVSQGPWCNTRASSRCRGYDSGCYPGLYKQPMVIMMNTEKTQR